MRALRGAMLVRGISAVLPPLVVAGVGLAAKAKAAGPALKVKRLAGHSLRMGHVAQVPRSAPAGREHEEVWGPRKITFWHPGGVHALYTPAANLAHLAYLSLCRISKLLILQVSGRF